MNDNAFAFGFAWYVIFLFSTVLHEASHALVAWRGGDSTAEHQITLDPLPHIRREPFGMVVVPWLVFLGSVQMGGAGWMMGWASTPFDPFWAARHPHRAARMALAGPLANLLLAVLGGVLIHVGRSQGWWASSDGPAHIIGLLLFILFELNVILFVFNLLPFPPLDGSSAITLIMPESGARRWQENMRNPYISMLTLMAVWFLFPGIISPILSFAERLVLS